MIEEPWFASAIRYLLKERQAIIAAPISFIIAVALVSGAIGLGQYYFSLWQAGGKDAQISILEKQVSLLRDQLSVANNSSSSPPQPKTVGENQGPSQIIHERLPPQANGLFSLLVRVPSRQRSDLFKLEVSNVSPSPVIVSVEEYYVVVGERLLARDSAYSPVLIAPNHSMMVEPIDLVEFNIGDGVGAIILLGLTIEYSLQSQSPHFQLRTEFRCRLYNDVKVDCEQVEESDQPA